MLSLKKKFEISAKAFPWYYGFSADLIFYVAINTVWLISVKGFSDVQMNLLGSVASFTALVFIYPMLIINKKIGNVLSIRLGAFCLLLSSIILTFGNSYSWFVAGEVVYELALLFAMMSSIVLKNNLEYLGKMDKFVDIRSRGSLIYAVLTAIATLTCGFLFNLHTYLPMVLGILFCLISFIFSLFITDLKSQPEEKKEKKAKSENVFKKQTVEVILIIAYFAVAFGVVAIAQKNGKLLIQKTLLEGFSIEKTAIYLSYAMFVSRVMRIIGNMILPKIYKKMGDWAGIILVLTLFVACATILFGAFVNFSIYVRAIIMSAGFAFLPMLRDPMKIFTHDMVFKKIDKQFHEDVFAYMTLGKNIFNFILSLAVSSLLIKYELKSLFVIFVILILPLFYVGYKIIKIKK